MQNRIHKTIKLLFQFVLRFCFVFLLTDKNYLEQGAAMFKFCTVYNVHHDLSQITAVRINFSLSNNDLERERGFFSNLIFIQNYEFS